MIKRSLLGASAAAALLVAAAAGRPSTGGIAPGDGASGPGGSGHSTSSGGRGEDCFDNKDNNGDGLIDCADPVCNDTACTAIPIGWTPIRARQIDDPLMDPGMCSGGAVPKVYYTE